MHKRTVLFVAALAFTLALLNLPPVAQAQTPASYGIMVDNPHTYFCPTEQWTYRVHVVADGTIGLNDPIELSYVGITTGVSVSAEIEDASVGNITGTNPITNYSPQPDLAKTDTLEFTFKALKTGATVIHFRATVDGVEAREFFVQVRVHCRLLVSGTSRWTIPGPNGGVYHLSGAISAPIKVTVSENGVLSGSGTVTWHADVENTPCAFPYTLNTSAVQVKGNINPDGTATVLMNYAKVSTTENEKAICAGYVNTAKHTISLSNLSVKANYLDNPISLPQNITSPMQVGGSAEIYVYKDESDEGN